MTGPGPVFAWHVGAGEMTGPCPVFVWHVGAGEMTLPCPVFVWPVGAGHDALPCMAVQSFGHVWPWSSAGSEMSVFSAETVSLLPPSVSAIVLQPELGLYASE